MGDTHAVNAKDYLIDQAGFDWHSILAGWAEILPETFSIWLVNFFGDVFIIADDGAVHLLDIAGGTFSRVSNNRDQFATFIDVPENADNWLMIPLVDQCVELGILLEPGKCYGFKIPPLLGGLYEPGNVAVVDLVQNYAFLADIWSQTKNVPDGTPVRLMIGKPLP
jgi:hypothetical protein